MVKNRIAILLVEDDLSLRDSLCDFLQDSGYETLAAGTLREAWGILHTNKPSVCLLDMNLPDGSGRDLLKHVTRQKLGTRVIVMTAFDLQPLRPQDSGDTVVGWLTKPVNPMELLQLVETASHHGTAAASKPARSGGVK